MLTSAVVDELCSRLIPGTELVLFDTNRKAKLRQPCPGLSRSRARRGRASRDHRRATAGRATELTLLCFGDRPQGRDETIFHNTIHAKTIDFYREVSEVIDEEPASAFSPGLLADPSSRRISR